jgi:carbohydrate diacid regulator
VPKDLGLASFVCHGDAALKSAAAQRLLQPLLDKAELLATLDTFLRTNLSRSLAAEQLSIHRHTLDYRLNKIAELTGLDPRDFGAAAQLLAALLWLGMEGVSGDGASVEGAEQTMSERSASRQHAGQFLRL